MLGDINYSDPLNSLFATAPAVMDQVLGIVYRAIASHLIKAAGMTRATARTGAVTLIHRFGSALNLNIHFHISFLDADGAGSRPSRRLPIPAMSLDGSD